MNTERLSDRLTAVASFVEDGAIVADIGSDHAYLPCFLINSGKIKKAIAGEVATGPFESAVTNVEREGLSHVIDVRLANGLLAVEIDDVVDNVTIAGMGGPLIASILDNGKDRLKTVKRIITQPNIYAKAIRDWAMDNGWSIVNEHILKEDGKIYEIIVLERGKQQYSELELLVGPYLLASKSVVFMEKWEREMKEWHRVLKSMESADETETIQNKKEQLIKQIAIVGKALEK